MKKSMIIFFAAILALCASCNPEPNLPEANFKSGTYNGSVTVELSCSSKNCRIYYTFGQSDPLNGIEYTEPITITYSRKLRFVAINQKGYSSSWVDEIYGIQGPAGGLVFYDCDADNDETNDGAGPDNLKSDACGWRYLEAAPEDMADGATREFVFGYYRESANGNNLYVNGTTTYEEGTADGDDGKCTGTAIGTGKANTAKLVSKMGDSAYSDANGSDQTANYAAKRCDDYTGGGYSDWFLPSKDELDLIYSNLSWNGLGGFIPDAPDTYFYYWSSSEDSGFLADSAWGRSFYIGGYYNISRVASQRVRAVRSYM